MTPTTAPELADLADLAVGTLLGNLHLSALSVAYWLVVGAFVVTRWGLGRRETSDRLRPLVVALGVLAVTVAAVDVAVRGATVTHVSLVAYLATPLGIGRFLVAKGDALRFGTPQPTVLRRLGLRLLSYGLAFACFVLLSALDGQPWFFSAPDLDATSVTGLLDDTAWMPLMATVFGLTAVVDLLSSAPGALRSRLGRRRTAQPA